MAESAVTFLLLSDFISAAPLCNDILDEFVTRMKILRRCKGLKRGSNFVKKLIIHHKFATEIQSIRMRVREVSEGRSRYQLERDEGNPSSIGKIHTSFFLVWRNLTSGGSTSLVWNLVNSAMPENENQSRIIITTRDSRVATMVDIDKHSYFLGPLKETESFDLFSIVAMGGIMSRKPLTPMEWRRVLEDPDWEVNDSGHNVSRVLSFSYNDLPLHLKSCFLYCSLFPEDYLIQRKRLINLWIAEGFVESRPGKVIEDVADKYLEELLDRSMLLVGEVGNDGDVYSCQVHDLLREFSIPIAKEEISGESYGGKRNFEPSETTRRLFTVAGNVTQILKNRHMSRVCSLLVFPDNNWNVSFGEPLIHNFKRLRVLYADGIYKQDVPITLRDAVHLRYAGIHKGYIFQQFPNTIQNLVNLQTLDMWRREPMQLMLPETISNLQDLRHINTRFSGEIILVKPKSIRNLENLQTLG
ncbi:hypothetical protein AMTRI_Chr10g7910 [Amborella trichopoda]